MQKKNKKQQAENMSLKEIKEVLNDIWTELTELNRLVSIFENADLLELIPIQRTKLKNKAATIKQKVTTKLSVLPF